MIESIRKMWKIEELRKKILYTFMMLILFRLVGVIPAPGVDVQRVMSQSNTSTLPLLELVNMMTGNAFSQMTLMAMGITPYINASIIMQLLTIAITRYVTVGLAALQAIGLVRGLGYIKAGWLNYVLVGVSMAGGTALAMWIGERITEKGVGNGVSLLIFVGIISNLFNGIVSGFNTATTTGTTSGWVNLIVIVVTCILMTVVVTFVELGERRIPLQIAKQVKGRRVYGGQNTHMSLKVVSVGVLPLIFAHPHEPESGLCRRAAPDLRLQLPGFPGNHRPADQPERRVHPVVEPYHVYRKRVVHDRQRAADHRLHLLLLFHQFRPQAAG